MSRSERDAASSRLSRRDERELIGWANGRVNRSFHGETIFGYTQMSDDTVRLYVDRDCTRYVEVTWSVSGPFDLPEADRGIALPQVLAPPMECASAPDRITVPAGPATPQVPLRAAGSAATVRHG